MERILVIDFGGQYAHLIVNRLRRLGFYTELCGNNEALHEAKRKGVMGLVFSGGPASVYENGAPSVDKRIFSLGIPILGIC